MLKGTQIAGGDTQGIGAALQAPSPSVAKWESSLQGEHSLSEEGR